MNENTKALLRANPLWLSATAVYRKLGDCQAQVQDLVEAGLLPPPVDLDGQGAGWPSDEVTAIVSARIEGTTEDEIRHLVKKLVAARDSGRVAGEAD